MEEQVSDRDVWPGQFSSNHSIPQKRYEPEYETAEVISLSSRLNYNSALNDKTNDKEGNEE